MRSPATDAKKLVFVLVVLLVGTGLVPSATSAQTAPQVPAAAPAAAPAASPAPQQPQLVCGNSLCYEANDFAATITSFRTSTQGYLKIIDIVMRFQNKTNAPITLGYVLNSGTATDDRGNRYGVWGANGFRGIGQVYGNSFDPRFTLRPGGFGDSQFELAWNPGQTVYGLTFQVDLTVDEINTVEGNQHTLGGEFPLHFQGLANGAGAASPAVTNLIPATGGGAAATAGNAVGAAGNPAAAAASATQAGCNAANQTGAAAAATNVANAVSNIGSLFGRKKPATQNTAQASNSSGPCDPANNQPQTPTANTTPAPAANAPPAPAASAAPTPAANTANRASAKPAPKPAAPNTTAPNTTAPGK